MSGTAFQKKVRGGEGEGREKCFQIFLKRRAGWREGDRHLKHR
jgi:hypothetical protein